MAKELPSIGGVDGHTDRAESVDPEEGRHRIDVVVQHGDNRVALCHTQRRQQVRNPRHPSCGLDVGKGLSGEVQEHLVPMRGDRPIEYVVDGVARAAMPLDHGRPPSLGHRHI